MQHHRQTEIKTKQEGGRDVLMNLHTVVASPWTLHACKAETGHARSSPDQARERWRGVGGGEGVCEADVLMILQSVQ